MTYALRHKWAERLARFDAPKANSRLVAKNTLILYFRMLVVMLVGLFTSRIQLKALGIENCDFYLRYDYGDYMKLPPETSRHPTHSYQARCPWWLGPTTGV